MAISQSLRKNMHEDIFVHAMMPWCPECRYFRCGTPDAEALNRAYDAVYLTHCEIDERLWLFEDPQVSSTATDRPVPATILGSAGLFVIISFK